MKYTSSMEAEGKRAQGNAWRERYLVDRAGSGREKRELAPTIEDVSGDPVVTCAVPTENISFIDGLNARLVTSGATSAPPDWHSVLAQAELDQERTRERVRADSAARFAEQQQWVEEDAAYQEEIEAEVQAQREAEDAARMQLSTQLAVPPDAIDVDALHYLMQQDLTEEELRTAWATKPWEQDLEDPTVTTDYDDLSWSGPEARFSAELQALIRPGETLWTLERNAAAAGFIQVADYLIWRSKPDA